MKITLNSSRLKKAVAKAVKGTGNDAITPITTMMGIKTRAGKLILCAKDGINSVQVIIDKVDCEDFSITVSAETFSKLVSKITSENVTFEITESHLLVKADGNYKIALTTDEEGVVDFPDINFNTRGSKAYEIKTNVLTSILNSNKAALALTFEDPHLTGYYIKDFVMTSNRETVCSNAISLCSELKETELLINPEMMNLLALIDSESVKLMIKGEQLYFESADMIIEGKMLHGLNDYKEILEMLVDFVNTDFKSSCKISKTLLLSVLDRLTIFIDVIDEFGADLTFTKDGLLVTSKSSSSEELIKYTESNDFEEFSCTIDTREFKNQVATHTGNDIEIHYGNESCIKLKKDLVTQIIALKESVE